MPKHALDVFRGAVRRLVSLGFEGRPGEVEAGLVDGDGSGGFRQGFRSLCENVVTVVRVDDVGG